MSVNIEDILLLKAQQDANNRENNGLAIAAGGTLGTALGVLGGQPAHVRGYKSLETKLKDRMPSSIRPGARMAGGLVGMALGGALGPGVAQLMIGNSGAGELLAKIQVGQELSRHDQQRLISILGEQYDKATGA
jgi:hypothetical protein